MTAIDFTADDWARIRGLFRLPEGLYYFNGNSLGPCTQASRTRVEQAVTQEWSNDLVRGWNTAGWVDLPLTAGEKLAPILGAAPGQTIVCDSTSVNAYKLLVAALARHPDRRLVLLERGAFPSDNYIAQGIARQFPHLELRVVSAGELTAALSSETAAVLYSHINYRTGERVDLPAVQARAASFDIPVVWDLAHSAGAVPLYLDDWQVEYAVGCGYKFLNGGPGAPAFAYVARDRLDALDQPIQGWFGHARPFAFDPDYAGAAGIQKLQVGTPPILSMAAFDAALDVFAGLDMEAVWSRSCALFHQFLQGMETSGLLGEFTLLTPREDKWRGSQISLVHPQAYEICRALADHNVIADYREPQVLRFGLAPLYLSGDDVDHCAEILKTIIRQALWRDPSYAQRAKVT